MEPFLELLRKRVVIGDGAMGTELLARGASRQGSLSELNTGRPELVLQVHRDYVEAGAELIRTNTFTANRLRLSSERVWAVNAEGVGLARRAAGAERFVAGSVGPLHDIQAPEAEKRAAYAEQVKALADSGCDLLILETYMDLDDLLLATSLAVDTGLPVIAQAASPGIASRMKTVKGRGAAVVGVNCIPPARAAEMLGEMGDPAEFPHSAFPSAASSGPDRDPAGFADLIRTLTLKGVRLIGGCCGTTPSHIRELARGVRR